MPKAAFRLLWDTLKAGEEWFGFVKNLTSTGDHYWVFANITTDYRNGQPVGYYSVRRPILNRDSLKDIEALYAQMRQIENAQGIDAALAHLNDLLAQQKLSYRQFVLKCYGAA
jgi:aerotaxis receptor